MKKPPHILISCTLALLIVGVGSVSLALPVVPALALPEADAPLAPPVPLPQPDPAAVIPFLDVTSFSSSNRLGPQPCPATKRELVDRAKEAWTRQDVNMLASIYPWHGQTSMEAAVLMNNWGLWVGYSVIGFQAWTEVDETQLPDQVASATLQGPFQEDPSADQQQGNFIRFSSPEDQDAVPYVPSSGDNGYIDGFIPPPVATPAQYRVVGIDIVQQLPSGQVGHVLGRFVKDKELACWWLANIHQAQNTPEPVNSYPPQEEPSYPQVLNDGPNDEASPPSDYPVVYPTIEPSDIPSIRPFGFSPPRQPPPNQVTELDEPSDIEPDLVDEQ